MRPAPSWLTSLLSAFGIVSISLLWSPDPAGARPGEYKRRKMDNDLYGKWSNLPVKFRVNPDGCDIADKLSVKDQVGFASANWQYDVDEEHGWSYSFDYYNGDPEAANLVRWTRDNDRRQGVYKSARETKRGATCGNEVLRLYWGLASWS